MGLFPGAGSECRDGSDAEQRAVPGALLGACQAAAGHSGVGEAPQQLPGSLSVPGVARGIRQRQPRSSEAGRARGEGRCGAGSAGELLQGCPFDVRELLRYLS